MKLSALFTEIHFDDFLGVVPRAAGIGHENGLKQTEESDADEVADEEVSIEEGQRQGKAEHDDENVPHPLLGINGADADDFLAVLLRGRGGREVHVFLDVNHRAIRAGNHRLAGGPGEPVNDRATHNQAQNNFGLDYAQGVNDGFERAGQFRGQLDVIHVLQQHDDAEHHRGRAHDRRADEHRLGRGFESVARAVAFFELILGVFKIRVETEIALDFSLDVFARLDLAQFIDRLGIVRDRKPKATRPKAKMGLAKANFSGRKAAKAGFWEK